MKTFVSADILLPKQIGTEWSVIACDQFTSSSEYWKKVEQTVGDKPSTLNLIFPEIYLGEEERIEKIHSKMNEYLEDGLFDEYKNALILVERTLPSGKIRRGIVGKANLNQYPDKGLRATEATVTERVPPRVKIRSGGALELPHVLLFLNSADAIPETSNGKILYDFDLMLGGGHVKGTLLTEEEKESFLEKCDRTDGEFAFAVGDGNHSLAAAKASGSDYALCEAVSVYDGAIVFEPIYRVVKNVKPADLLDFAVKYGTSGNKRIKLVSREGEREICTDTLPVKTVDEIINAFKKNNPEIKVDYIHGTDDLKELANQEKTVGFLFGGIEKSELFPYIAENGVLPKKTFSMGTAYEKRYYTEAMKI